MKTTLLFCGITAAAVSLAAAATPEKTTQSNGRAENVVAKNSTSTATASGAMSAADKQFAEEAAKGGMMEVEMGKMAAKNAKDAQVKNFGNTMVTDHTRANNQLMSIAAKKKMKLPGKSSAGSWKSDKDYVQMMVQDHQKDVALFDKEAKNGTDPDLKNFARQTSTIIRGHLKMAQKLASTVK